MGKALDCFLFLCCVAFAVAAMFALSGLLRIFAVVVVVLVARELFGKRDPKDYEKSIRGRT